ncbi:hypothetical protein C479_08003 [Halovivax asiaticus JCM 14624]|uniref:Uncharacterized protein n=1 Tax=Halovivax asiaticus JCM 14624 TaxID=1227490 RepID=M0BKA4_9EURY|nr:hypothetical protein [Halovivax asiaticus]ELZ10738.1 hypothetical protein C479_08003 [Halovivax asiaticus JCM 14624]
MAGGDTITGRVSEITTKLEADETLDADDVTFLSGYVSTIRDYRALDGYRDEIDDAITGGIGHAAYVKILQEFEATGVLDELRSDLIDPSLDPNGFERVEVNGTIHYRSVMIGEQASEGVGWIHPPDKQPATLVRIRDSLFDYLFCTGRGFRLDAEMIYAYEADYEAFLRTVIDCTEGLDDYRLSVHADESGQRVTISVTLRSGGRSYSTEFDHGTDWLQFAALDPVQDALDQEGVETVHYRGGNDGWILVLDDQLEEQILKRLPEWYS